MKWECERDFELGVPVSKRGEWGGEFSAWLLTRLTVTIGFVMLSIPNNLGLVDFS